MRFWFMAAGGLSTYLTAGETNGDNAQVVGVGEEAAFNGTGVHCNGV